MYEWPVPTTGHPINLSAIVLRASGPEWLWAGLARDPFLTRPLSAKANGRPGPRRAQRPCHAASAVYTLCPGPRATTPRSTATRASSTSTWREVCALPPRTPHTPHLAAAQEPLGAPGSLAIARLAHQASQQSWLGGPDHMGGSLGGRGFAPTPNPEPPRLGGGLVYR